MAAVDFLTVPTIRFQVLYVFPGPGSRPAANSTLRGDGSSDAEWTGQQLREAFPWTGRRVSCCETVTESLALASPSKWGNGDRGSAGSARSATAACVHRVGHRLDAPLCLDHVIIFNEASFVSASETIPGGLSLCTNLSFAAEERAGESFGCSRCSRGVWYCHRLAVCINRYQRRAA